MKPRSYLEENLHTLNVLPKKKKVLINDLSIHFKIPGKNQQTFIFKDLQRTNTSRNDL